MADQAGSIQMIVAEVNRARPLQIGKAPRIGAETNEMDAICKTRLQIIEIVTDIDDPVLGDGQ